MSIFTTAYTAAPRRLVCIDARGGSGLSNKYARQQAGQAQRPLFRLSFSFLLLLLLPERSSARHIRRLEHGTHYAPLLCRAAIRGGAHRRHFSATKQQVIVENRISLPWYYFQNQSLLYAGDDFSSSASSLPCLPSRKTAAGRRRRCASSTASALLIIRPGTRIARYIRPPEMRSRELQEGGIFFTARADGMSRAAVDIASHAARRAIDGICATSFCCRRGDSGLFARLADAFCRRWRNWRHYAVQGRQVRLLPRPRFFFAGRASRSLFSYTPTHALMTGWRRPGMAYRAYRTQLACALLSCFHFIRRMLITARRRFSLLFAFFFFFDTPILIFPAPLWRPAQARYSFRRGRLRRAAARRMAETLAAPSSFLRLLFSWHVALMLGWRQQRAPSSPGSCGHEQQRARKQARIELPLMAPHPGLIGARAHRRPATRRGVHIERSCATRAAAAGAAMGRSILIGGS